MMDVIQKTECERVWKQITDRVNEAFTKPDDIGALNSMRLGVVRRVNGFLRGKRIPRRQPQALKMLLMARATAKQALTA